MNMYNTIVMYLSRTFLCDRIPGPYAVRGRYLHQPDAEYGLYRLSGGPLLSGQHQRPYTMPGRLLVPRQLRIAVSEPVSSREV